MAEYIEREALRDALYEADAITMRGVAILNQFPAADVRPVVRGTWEDYYEVFEGQEENGQVHCGYVCSVCGRWEMEKEPFCNCGADMREES